MAEKDVPPASEIRASTQRDSSERLKTEIKEAFPSLEPETIANLTREELVELVFECR